ncbi:unnamed protein product [Lupinus luteus]|uniref:Uncharacterized protein n=1 Tax=Lupinus luteus TaxID=3873 RepID=A0AAV1XPH9_LUPLU
MSNFEGVVVHDQWLNSQFMQVELRRLKSKVIVIMGMRVLIKKCMCHKTHSHS